MDAALVFTPMKRFFARWKRNNLAVHPQNVDPIENYDENKNTLVDSYQSLRNRTQGPACLAHFMDLASLCCMVVQRILVGIQLYPSVEDQIIIEILEM
eukprot:8982668-Ditylum_brightwellii.AAC.1